MKIIETRSGDAVMVDDDDFEILSKFKWYSVRASYRGRTWRGPPYVRTYAQGRHVFMHRMLLAPPDGMEVDHIDGNTLNNQRENLRVVTPALNKRYAKARRAYDLWIEGPKNAAVVDI